MDKRIKLTVLAAANDKLIFHFPTDEESVTSFIIASTEFKKVNFSFCHPNPNKI